VSNFKLFGGMLEFMGMSKSDANLIIKRNSEFCSNPILTNDTRMMHEQRYDGLSNMEKALAESHNNEFGHLNNRDSHGRIKF